MNERSVPLLINSWRNPTAPNTKIKVSRPRRSHLRASGSSTLSRLRGQKLSNCRLELGHRVLDCGQGGLNVSKLALEGVVLGLQCDELFQGSAGSLVRGVS